MARFIFYIILCFVSVSNRAVYCGAGLLLESVSLLAHGGAVISRLCPLHGALEKECHLLGKLCHRSATYSFSQVFEGPSRKAYTAWQENKQALSQIPTASLEDEHLLDFLTNRFLAKTTGFYPVLAEWVYPCFGINLQIHPETSNTYARKPSDEPSYTYQKVAKQLITSSPHPPEYPLILTRPVDIREYLPERQQFELIDCTDKSAKWPRLKKEIGANHPQPESLLCFERLHGALRLLPLEQHTKKVIKAQHDFLLEWISTFGLTTNRVELDRFWHQPRNQNRPLVYQVNPSPELAMMRGVIVDHPQKQLMLNATYKVLFGLIPPTLRVHSQTEEAALAYSLSKMKASFLHLKRSGNDLSLFDFISELELIHAHLSSILEILRPYEPSDFPSIYKAHLKGIPTNLKSLTRCSVHSSGMTSLSGIFKALPKDPTIVYGKNTYFECIMASKRIGKTLSLEEATLEDLKNVNLILGQFNPALKRIELPPSEYTVENIEDTLKKILSVRGHKPLTLALDSTLDYLDSPHLASLLKEFNPYIEAGVLNIVCYRSGHKYDLFGLDNYNGAPFFTINSGDSQWEAFNALHSIPALQTDPLSLNWFCLSMKYAGEELEAYRRQIFENTRQFLGKVPRRLLDQHSPYHIVPFHQEAEAGFIDIKITGALHQFRGASLAGGALFLRSMEAKHALFYRPSLGFYHPNYTMLFSKDNTTIRLTLGLDPDQVDHFVSIFEELDTLNEI